MDHADLVYLSHTVNSIGVFLPINPSNYEAFTA